MAEEVDPIKKSSELISKTIPKVGETLIDADKTGTKLGSVPADATVDKQADVTQAVTAGEGVKVPDVAKPDKPEEGIGLVDKTTDVKDIGKSDVAIGEVSKEIGDIVCKEMDEMFNIAVRELEKFADAPEQFGLGIKREQPKHY